MMMKINSNRETLIKGIQTIQAGVSSKTGTIPILQNFLMETEDKGVKVVFTPGNGHQAPYPPGNKRGRQHNGPYKEIHGDTPEPGRGLPREHSGGREQQDLHPERQVPLQA